MKSMKKAISLLLALVMCLGMLPMSAFAADVPEHEHNQNGWQCVYTEPVTKTDCTHQHDGTCGYAAPTEGSSCTHEHNADCGYAAAVEGVACTCGAVPDENGVVTHTDDCAYVEAKAEEPCKHQHDGTCGYVEAKAEVPCTHVCSEESGCVAVVTEGYWTCTAPVAEEVPAQVQAFLDAVAALPAPETVTKDNAEAVGVQVNAVLDMYEGLIDAGLDEREDVAGALPTVYAVYNAVLAAEEIPEDDTFSSSMSKSAIQYAKNCNEDNDLFKGIVNLDGDAITDSGTPTIYTTGMWGGAKPVSYWVNAVNEGHHDSSIVDVKVTTDGGKLSVTFTPGTRGGTTTVQVSGTAYYNHDSLGMYPLGITFRYSVTNKGTGSGGGTTEPGVPSAPSLEEMSDIQVKVSCVKANGSTNSSCYNMTRDLTAYPNNYTIGDVVKNPGTKYSSSSYPYMCTITLNNEAWKDTFATILRQQTGIATPHYVHSKTGTVTKDFYYGAGDGIWRYETPSTMSVYVTETAPTPTATTYKIVREYYINGGLIATVKGGAENGTVGQKLVGQTIADQNSGWVNRPVDGETHTFTYAGSYEGSYNANDELTVGAKADSVTLTANTSTNVIVLRYEENTPVTYTVQWLDADGSPIKAEATRHGNVGEKVEVTDADKTVTGYTFDASNPGNKLSDILASSGTVLKLYFTKDAPVDDGKGITVEKTRTAINGDTSKTTAKAGDTITWNITVKNNSNVEKTVTLTELAGVTLSKNPVTLEAGKSETVTATYVVQAADAGKTFTNTVTATTDENETATDTDDGTTITPEQITVTWLNGYSESPEDIIDTKTVNKGISDADLKKLYPADPTRDGWTFVKWGDPTTDGDGNITIIAQWNENQVSNPALTGITKELVSVSVNGGTAVADPTGLTVKAGDTVKLTYTITVTGDEGAEYVVTDPGADPATTSGTLNDSDAVITVTKTVTVNETMTVKNTAFVKPGSDTDPIPDDPSKPTDPEKGHPSNEVTTEITVDNGDDGKGISITKTRVSVNGDPNAKAAAPGDEIVWEITVTNNSNVEKTVTLTEKLTSAVLSEKQVTLAAGASKTVTATYTVKSSDNGKTLVNAVVATTDNPDDGEKEAKDPGTPIIDVSKFKVNITKVNDAPNGMHTVPDNPYKLTAKFTVTVKNESGFDLYGLKLTDALTTTIKEKGTDTLVPQGEANKGAVVEFIPNSLTIKDEDGVHSYSAGEKSQSTVNGKTTREWPILNKDEVFKDGAVMTLVYDVTVESWYPKAITIKLDNWAEYETDDGLPAANTTLTYNVQAPRYFSLGLDNMFAGTHTGGAGSGTGSGTDGGSSTPETPTEPTQPGGGAGTSTGGEIGGRPDGGGGTEQPDQPVDPNPPVDPVDPDPYEPIIPDEPTPVAPNPPEVEIDDERTPLASANGLNSVDHFAYIIGYDDDTVRPENKITRAEVATIFFRLMTDVYRAANWSTTNDFSDVAAGSWYNNAISTCAKAGLVNGYSDGTFKPDQSITRAEFATIAARFLDEEITGAGAEGFADIEGHWAETNILRAAEAGWVNGDNGRFRPDDYISRAEVMTIVNRMLNRVPDEDHLLPEMKTWSDNPKTAWYYEAVQEATNEHAYEWIDENVENWTELLTIRDWAALEKEWATAYSAGN